MVVAEKFPRKFKLRGQKLCQINSRIKGLKKLIEIPINNINYIMGMVVLR